MKLASILDPDLIFCQLEGSDRRELYTSMLNRAKSAISEHINPAALCESIIKREDDLHTPYGDLAIPHTRENHLNDLYILIGIPATPVKLQPDDLSPARVIVMSLISDSTSGSYLKALAAFARYLSKPGNVDKLAACRNSSEVVQTIAADNVLVNRTLTAEDLMTTDYPSVHKDDSLADVFDTFYRERRQVLPVVDDANHLLGMVDAAEIIKTFIPHYIYNMENLNFLTSFELFEQIFKSENTYNVNNYIMPVKLLLSPDTPLIQFTIRLVRRESPTGFVVDAENRLLGAVGINNIVHKVLRG